MILLQQQESDMMYLKSFELNYSHEQLTPLNSILTNSKIAFRRYVDICNEQSNFYENMDIRNIDNEKELKAREAKHS